ncbi:hypothetical protein P5V15_012731 [Pogonomyrmex californicus]
MGTYRRRIPAGPENNPITSIPKLHYKKSLQLTTTLAPRERPLACTGLAAGSFPISSSSRSAATSIRSSGSSIQVIDLHVSENSIRHGHEQLVKFHGPRQLKDPTGSIIGDEPDTIATNMEHTVRIKMVDD